MHRFNLSNSMHVRIMGGMFLSNRKNNGRVTGATHEALKKRGLLDDECHRTDIAMAYIQEKCNARDKRLSERYPDVPFVSSDVGLLGYWQDFKNVSIYVYGGNDPLVVRDGNGTRPLAIVSTRLMWDIETGLTRGVKNAGRFLIYSSITGHKASYGYEFDTERVNEQIQFIHTDCS